MPPKAKQPKVELPAAPADAPVVTATALLATPRRTLPPHPSRAVPVGGGPKRTWSAPCFPRVPRASAAGDFRLSRLPSYVRALELIAPDFEPSAPIRLPDKPARVPTPVPAAAPEAAASDDAPAAADVKPVAATAEATPAEAPPTATATATATPAAAAANRIKLRDGWGYKIGGTRFRAVFDPSRKAIPKLPERQPGGYEVAEMKGEGRADSPKKKPPICLYVNSLADPAPKLPTRTPLKKAPKTNRVAQTHQPNTAPKRIGEYYEGIDRDAALAVKQCYDERLAEDPSSYFAALVHIITVEEGTCAPMEEHAYIGRPKCTHTAEIVTTFPLDQAAHYRKKKYKDDHVVIDSTELEDIYNEVHRIRMNRRRWARIKDRCAVDAAFAAKMRAKKMRGYAAEKAKIAAMSEEERKAINIRKYAYHKARKLEADPEQTAKKQRLEERRAANLARNKALLAAGVDDPEERRRLQRRIRQAERTPDERRELQIRDAEYQRRKKAWLANATPEQLAAFHEAKHARRVKHEALADLSPKQRMRVQQREYQANYTARRMAKSSPMPGSRGRASTSSPTKNKRKQDMRSVLDRAMKEEEEVDELEEDDDGEDAMVDVMGVNDDDHVDDYGGGGFDHDDDGSIIEEEENQMAARAIASPSPSPSQPPARNRGIMPAPSRPGAPHRHHQPHSGSSSSVFSASINYGPQRYHPEDDDDDVMDMGQERSPTARVYRPLQQQQSHHRQHLQHSSHYGQQGQQPHRYAGYIEIPEPSRVSARFGGDLEAELLQLQKDVAWSDKAIHNSRVEAERLRAEAESLESAIEEELQAQLDRKNRIARLMADWRDEHGEDSQG